MSPTDLDDRIREVVSHIAATASEPTPFADIPSHQLSPERSAERTRARGPLVAAAAGLALILVITGAIVWLRSNHDSSRVPAGRRLVLVTHEVVDYVEHGTLACPNGAPQVTGRFDRMRFESWGSTALGRFRTHVFYPDGSSRDRMIEGTPTYNGVTKTWARGEMRGKNYLGCDGHSGGPIEPGQTSVFSLNPLAPPPRLPDGRVNFPGPKLMDAIRVGTTKDSRGRRAVHWRHPMSFSRGPTGVESMSPDGEDWFVDARSNLILEYRKSVVLEGVGVTSARAVLISHHRTRVPASVFSTRGYETVLGFDVAQPTATARTTEITPIVKLGTGWIWPTTPRTESPVDAAHRFARDVLHWREATATAQPAPIGPTFVTLTQSGHRALRILMIPTLNGAQKIQQVGDGVGATSAGLALAFATFPNATSAEITSAPGGTLRAWRSLAPERGHNAQTTDIVKTGPAILILFRDTNGEVVGANGEVIGG